jgi:hypothetical protein
MVVYLLASPEKLTGPHLWPIVSVDKKWKSPRGEVVDRQNLKIINLSTHYKPGLALEMNWSPKERENKSTKK